MSLAFVLLALFVALTQAQVYQGGLGYEAGVNVSFTQTTTQFSYRYNEVTAPAGTGVFVDVSVQADGSVSTVGQGAFTANGIAVIGMFNTVDLGGVISIPPFIMVAFFNESGSINANSVSGGAFAGTASFGAKVYGLLQEVNTNNQVVSTIDLGTLVFTTTGIQVADASRGLQYASYTATANGATIAITMVVSAVLGVLNNGGAIITPTSVESFFEVDMYTYQASTNHLRLTMYVAQVASALAISVNGTLTAGTGASQVYFHMSETVLVNGQTQSVTINGLADIYTNYSSIPAAALVASIESAVTGGMTPTICQVTVDFPAGITTFTYDPTIGFGKPDGQVVNSGNPSGGGTGNGGGTVNSNASGLIPTGILMTVMFIAAFFFLA